MAKKHPRAYPLEFRSKIIALAGAGRRPEDLATEFEVANQTVRNWIRQADLDTGKRTDGLTSEERTELFTLRKKMKQLTIEREILSKAAAWFARRPRHCPRDLPTREEQSGQVPYFHDVPYAWGLHQRVLCVASPSAVCAQTTRRYVERSHRSHPSPVA
jgi:transposase